MLEFLWYNHDTELFYKQKLNRECKHNERLMVGNQDRFALSLKSHNYCNNFG